MTTPEQPNHLAKKVFSRIDGEGVTPRPRWEFILKNYVFWGLGVVTLVLGAFAAAAALFDVGDIDWHAYGAPVESQPSFMALVPVLWILSFALFLVVGSINIRRTKHGYRYPLPVLALGIILTSLTLGFALYASGMGERFETVVRPHLPHQFFFDGDGRVHHHRFHYDY